MRFHLIRKIPPQRVFLRVNKRLLIAMKLTIVLLTVVCLHAAANTIAQNISLSEKNISLEKVLKKIKAQSHYDFFYDRKVFSLAKEPIAIKLTNASIDQALELCFRDQANLTYAIIGKVIVIKQKSGSSKIFADTAQMQFASIVIHISDTAGAPLRGATVKVLGTSIVGQSDEKGIVNFVNVPDNAELSITYVGYQTVNIKITGKNDITVMMHAFVKGQAEVVVVGYGTQKKASMVSSVATVTGEDLSFSGRNLSNNLQGQVPGLISFQRSGEPGNDNATFWIRGISTFGGVQDPLIMVDGIKRSFNDVDPNEIATFSILKDAVATSVFGAEGANGVILVTTKRGRNQSGKPQIAYRGEATGQKPLRMPNYIGSVDFLSLWNEASLNDNNTLGTLPFPKEVIDKYRNNVDPDLYPNVNWLSVLLSKYTYSTNHNLSFRGGNDRARYFVSGAYYKESGIFANNSLQKYNSNIDLKRYNLRSNIDIDVTKTTLLSVNMAGQYLATNFPGTENDLTTTPTNTIFQRASIAPPYMFPAIYSDGTIAQHNVYDPGNRVNPYNLLNFSGYTTDTKTRIQTDVVLSQKLDAILRGLSARVTVGFDFNSQQRIGSSLQVNSFFATGRSIDGNLIYTQKTNGTGLPADANNISINNRQITVRGQLDYARTFKSIHEATAMLLTDRRDYITNYDRLPFRKEQYIGRATYQYDRRYSVEVNAAYSGSENFAPGNRFGLFPALGFAWTPSNESFFPAQNVISTLKFRYSYGLTGNDQVFYNGALQRFPYRGAIGGYAGNDPLRLNRFGQAFGFDYAQGSVQNLGTGTVIETTFSSPGLTWEKEKKRNYGMDVSFFNNALNLTMDYFDNYRYDILLARNSVSLAAGFTAAVFQNYGSVSNKGIDASVTYTLKLGNSSRLGFRGNFTFARNKIIQMDEPKNVYPWLNQTGNHLNATNLYVADRLFEDADFSTSYDANGKVSYTLLSKYANQTQLGPVAPGDIKYKDLNGDNIIDFNDRTKYLGHPTTPEINYGFGVSYTYKSISVSVFFAGIASETVVLGQGGGNFFPFTDGPIQSNIRSIVLNRWTADNPSQNVLFPRLHTSSGTGGNNYVPSTWWTRSGSFLRLKNAELDYQIPKKLLDKVKIQHAKIYLMGFNLLTFDKLKYWDPEQGADQSGLAYPQTAKLTFGLEVNF